MLPGGEAGQACKQSKETLWFSAGSAAALPSPPLASPAAPPVLPAPLLFEHWFLTPNPNSPALPNLAIQVKKKNPNFEKQQKTMEN